jgi:hypothetical protein
MRSLVLPDGREVVVTVGRVANRTELSAWNVTDGSLAHGPWSVLKTARPEAMDCVLLPDGRAAAVIGYSGGVVEVWDIVTGQRIGEPWRPDPNRVYAVACATLPDGRAVAVVGEAAHRARMWDISTGTRVGPDLGAHTWSVTGVACGRLTDGRPVAVTVGVGSEPVVCLWDLAGGALLASRSYRASSVGIITRPGERPVAFIGIDRTTGMPIPWDLEDAGHPLPASPRELRRPPAATQTASGHRIAATVDSSGVKIWSLTDQTLLDTITTPAPANAVAATADGRIIVAFDTGLVAVDVRGAYAVDVRRA